MTVPPDFGGHEIEEGLLEDLGGPPEPQLAPELDFRELLPRFAHLPCNRASS